MQEIRNETFSEKERLLLEFALQDDFPERDTVLRQLNNVSGTDILRDISPYYWIMEFRPGGVRAGYDGMHPIVNLLVLHEDSVVPTVFNLYEKDGHVFELEIFNADSSELDMDRIMIGRIQQQDGF